MRLSSAGLSLAFALSLGIAASPEARAQSDADRATARSLGQEGQQAFENKDYATAEDRFRRADKMVHAPTLVLGLARALAAEGKYVEAQESFNRIIREGVPSGAPDVFKRALDDAKKEVDAVTPKVGAVTITVKATGGMDIPDPQVVLDEHPINSASLGVRRAIDPGPHVLRATADGYKPGELKFSITEGGSADEPLMLEKDLSAPPVAAGPAPAAAPVASTSSVDLTTQGPSKARKIAPWVAFGVGGAGLLVGGITGILAIGKHSTLADECKPNCNSTTAQSDLDSYHSIGVVSDVGFIVAGVGGAVGAILLLTQPKAEATTQPVTGVRVLPVVGLGTVGATGSF
ncbi:MAG TPA: hypothetical protein VK762_19790 [Polyangiaceae bacterium]|jgi:hypothetical protein|nr:hypothetical protein [Polyangiaceae bacterium]